jgi:hypothetical protein
MHAFECELGHWRLPLVGCEYSPDAGVRPSHVRARALGAQSFAIGYDAASRVSFIADTGNPANSNRGEHSHRVGGVDTPSSLVAAATSILLLVRQIAK